MIAFARPSKSSAPKKEDELSATRDQIMRYIKAAENMSGLTPEKRQSILALAIYALIALEPDLTGVPTMLEFSILWEFSQDVSPYDIPDFNWGVITEIISKSFE